ncbi:2OG-Fe(II) oxygenase family protein [Methylophaga sp.]|uniref:2OG-Fe(II) oxygenase family protein n=1 Tax=Methylophaga sp. TaxID=2024840 RepID=UPI002726F44C|nr:2OG-Fe(II) oxygenase family protein [Methylophaga sp.]MDO8826872.1 2-oxoglutarate and iron-dependent oxygenase domain-containing protein [Methylophaga sp.]
MSHSIPIIDMQHTSANALVTALSEYSCVFLKNHGIEKALLFDVLASWDTFFALPLTQKQAVRWPGEGPWYGWQPVAESGPYADLMERFELRFESALMTEDRNLWAETFKAWPEQPENFKPSWTKLYFGLRDLSSQIMEMIAEGIGRIDEDMSAWTTKQHSNLVANHFYAQTAAPAKGRWRASPHTDIGGITLLWADHAPGGLEVAINGNGGKTWIPVMIPEDYWLLQVGDLIKHWTGGKIPANPHRVANPPADSVPQARRSIAFFHHPSPEVVVTPPTGDAQQGVTAEDYIIARQREDIAAGSL